MSEAPERIIAKINYDGEFDGAFVDANYPLPPSMDDGATEYVRADLSPQWRMLAFAIKGIVDDCCLTDERGKIVAFDHKDFEMRFHTLLAKEAPNEP